MYNKKNNVKSVRDILIICSIVCGALSVLFYTILGAVTDNYFIRAIVFVVICIALLLQVTSIVVKTVSRMEVLKDIIGIATAVLYMVGLMLFISGSIEWIQHLLSKDKVPAFTDFYYVSILFFVFGAVAQIAANFSGKE